MIPDLTVTQNEDGVFECVEVGVTGSPIVGRGASVVEATGNWAIYTATVHITCDPPKLLDYFTIKESQKTFWNSAPKRD